MRRKRKAFSAPACLCTGGVGCDKTPGKLGDARGRCCWVRLYVACCEFDAVQSLADGRWSGVGVFGGSSSLNLLDRAICCLIFPKYSFLSVVREGGETLYWTKAGGMALFAW